MIGADRFASLIHTGQYGRLYCVSGEHARGKTFRVFVLPEGEEAKSNGPHNAPLNSDAVEVFGITDGQPGWTETYGWIHEGPWVADLEKLALSFELKRRHEEDANKCTTEALAEEERQRAKDLLASYPGNESKTPIV